MIQSKPAKYRHELKYTCSQAQLALLGNRVKGLLELDAHVEADRPFYTIRSLYFDDYDNTCFYENENGTDPREKYRIRIYNGDGSRIRLERKQKVRGKTRKQSCPLTKEQCQAFMEGKGLPMREFADQPLLLQQFLAAWHTRLLRPKIIVEYERVPYVYPEGNVRITLDQNISSSKEVARFLEPELAGKRPVMPKGQQLLEVKFDEYLPDFIYRSLALENLQQTAFSKYYLCRKFSL